MNTLEAIKKRASTRAFLDKPVTEEQVNTILDAARWAPSGVNIQPWKVVAVRGETKKRIGDEMGAAKAAGEEQRPDHQYYPSVWEEPYKARRKACGLALYSALEITREDKEKQMKAWVANYHFFYAPVGLLFFMDKNLAAGSLIDMGMFIQSVMVCAVDVGLATCPQAALAEYPDLARSILGMDDSNSLLCGMSLGYADPAAAANSYRTVREPVESFLTWHD